MSFSPRPLCVLNLLVLLAFCPSVFSVPSKRQIIYADLAPDLRTLLNFSTDFDRYVETITRQTRQRQIEGENDHLIYFILQSQRFTSELKIEPALSAYEFVNSLDRETKARYLNNHSFAPPTEKIPRRAAQRIEAFLRALQKPNDDERLAYFQTWLRQNKKPGESARSYLQAQYMRAMRFLYEKEFLSPSAAAALYQSRGHSTDTQVEANYAVHVALAILKSQLGERQLNNVLIVGPGLDFAPRTDLLDVFDPQSYQPFAIADSLLQLQLARRQLLRVHSVDINHRVVDYLRRFPARKNKQLSILSGVADTARRPLTADYKKFFENFGTNIGSPVRLAALPEQFQNHLGKSLAVDSEVAQLIGADQLNIVTERYDPSPRYDLVIVTNVLPYFNDSELLLALSNLEAMIGEGGYLVHNESRPLLFSLTNKLKLPMLHSRTVLISAAAEQPLYDRVYVHRK